METENAPKGLQARLSFIYAYTGDLEATRRFYTDMLGLAESEFRPDWLYLAYDLGDKLMLMFFQAQQSQPVPGEFADQPGWQGGTRESLSWSIGVPEHLFGSVVKELRRAGTTCFRERPAWCQDSYWGFPVLDPNGMTVEVFTIPAVKPSSTDWPG